MATVQDTSTQIRVVTTKNYVPAALTLAHAFLNDPASRYYLDTPDREHWSPEKKWSLHHAIMSYLTYAHCLKGVVTTRGPVLTGTQGPMCSSVALWLPPGSHMDSAATILRSGLWRLHYRLSSVGRARFFTEFLPLLHKTKTAVLGPRDDHAYYLVYLGTHPSAQGKGHAKALIADMAAKADREGRPCYLESSREINNKIYAKCGFVVQRRIWVGNGKDRIALDIMVREPRTGAAEAGPHVGSVDSTSTASTATTASTSGSIDAAAFKNAMPVIPVGTSGPGKMGADVAIGTGTAPAAIKV